MMGIVDFRGVPNQPESASRSASAAVSVGSSMDAAQAMWASGRIRRASGGRVADVGAGDEGSDAAQGLLVDEQFLEELPECFGGWVVSAPQRHLGLRVQQGACPGEVAFVVVRVQQAGRRP